MALERIDWPEDDIRWYWRLWDTLVFWNHRPGIPTADPSLDRGTYLSCFKAILSRCNVNLRPQRFGQTILHEIAAMGPHVSDVEVNGFAQVALDAGVSLTERDDLLCSTPLAWASRWGRGDLVRLLVSRGAQVNETGAAEWSQPLSWALRYRHQHIADLLRGGAGSGVE
jgi:hypothetical protein